MFSGADLEYFIGGCSAGVHIVCFGLRCCNADAHIVYFVEQHRLTRFFNALGGLQPHKPPLCMDPALALVR